MAGISGSGKSTHAATLAESLNGVIVCPDTIRGELSGGNESDQSFNTMIFTKLLPMRIATAFSASDVVIYDATNVDEKARKTARSWVPANYSIELHYIHPDLERALAQNKNRTRQVPEEVIKSQFKRWINPETSANKDKYSKIVEIL